MKLEKKGLEQKMFYKKSLHRLSCNQQAKIGWLFHPYSPELYSIVSLAPAGEKKKSIIARTHACLKSFIFSQVLGLFPLHVNNLIVSQQYYTYFFKSLKEIVGGK